MSGKCLEPEERSNDAADLNRKHDRVPDHGPGIKFDESVKNRPRVKARDGMGIPGLCEISHGSSPLRSY